MDIRAHFQERFPEQIASFESTVRESTEDWTRFGPVSLSMGELAAKKGGWWKTPSDAAEHGDWGTFWYEVLRLGSEGPLSWEGICTLEVSERPGDKPPRLNVDFTPLSKSIGGPWSEVPRTTVTEEPPGFTAVIKPTPKKYYKWEHGPKATPEQVIAALADPASHELVRLDLGDIEVPVSALTTTTYPRLTHLAFHGSPTAEEMDAVCAAAPALTDLHLTGWPATRPEGINLVCNGIDLTGDITSLAVEADDLKGLDQMPGYAQIEHLTVHKANDKACRLLAKVPPPSLKTLDLSHGYVTDKGADAISAFTAEVDLRHNKRVTPWATLPANTHAPAWRPWLDGIADLHPASLDGEETKVLKRVCAPLLKANARVAAALFPDARTDLRGLAEDLAAYTSDSITMTALAGQFPDIEPLAKALDGEKAQDVCSAWEFLARWTCWASDLTERRTETADDGRAWDSDLAKRLGHRLRDHVLG